ncbi:MAG: hypothetical protein HYY24_09085 [Verrucomicrobia bacterium]|nr:hypothetical protein [Verrucomicrobiota bacterium]
MRTSKVALVLLASCQALFGQTDTNLVATGEWSTPVTDGAGYTLRARILVYRPLAPKPAVRNRGRFVYHARVYVELEHPFAGAWYRPVEIYFDPVEDLRFQMQDAFDKPIPSEAVAIRGRRPEASWVTIPCDAAVKLRADLRMGSQNGRHDALTIGTRGGHWIIRPDATNDFFLSAQFSPSTNQPSAFGYHRWRGTLNLPKVKIPRDYR